MQDSVNEAGAVVGVAAYLGLRQRSRMVSSVVSACGTLRIVAWVAVFCGARRLSGWSVGLALRTLRIAAGFTVF